MKDSAGSLILSYGGIGDIVQLINADNEFIRVRAIQIVGNLSERSVLCRNEIIRKGGVKILVERSKGMEKEESYVALVKIIKNGSPMAQFKDVS